MFYDVTPDGLGDMTHDEYLAADDDGRVVEIWNDVFMQYEKRDGKVIGKLSQKNVDTGSGLERVTMLVQGKTNVYETDFFKKTKKVIEENLKLNNEKAVRIILDHLRSSVFLIGDGVFPSNKDQGYVLRRLIRRAVRYMDIIGLDEALLSSLVSATLEPYIDTYNELVVQAPQIAEVIRVEETKFRKTLKDGLKEFEKGVDPFILATTYGFPIELTEELAQEKGVIIDRVKFDAQMAEHQVRSRAGAEQKFKGGLANTNEQTVRLHTAHHLLLAALQSVLGKEVHQKGSNITEERLRIDFNFDRKLTNEEKIHIEKIVNDAISKDLHVVRREMSLAEAQALGAEMEFGAKYPEIVSVYFIEDENGTHFSKEFCGGPHVTHTGELGAFKIQKEEAVSQGVRRIKAILL
jgi:alanyl-tRNA synthetase